MLSEVRNLRDIAERCQSGRPLGEDLSRWLATLLQDFLDHRHRSLDDALGLRAARGGVPWWLEEGLRQRNAALRALAGQFYPNDHVLQQAKLIRSLAARYAASAWLWDRARQAMPDHYRGTPEESLWRAFKSGAPMPIGERQLRTILGR